MEKGRMTTHQMFALTVLFLFGNCIIFGVNTVPGRDAWIAMLISTVLSIPFLWMYSRILKHYPGKGLFDIMLSALGRVAGKIAIFLFVCYALLITSLAVRSLTEFVDTNSLPEPPHMLFPVAFVCAGIYLLRKGLPVLGKWAVVMLYVTLGALFLTALFSMKDLHPEWVFPILRKEPEVMVRATFRMLTLPLLECVLVLPLFSHVQKDARPFRLLLGSIFLTAGCLVFVLLRNILLLGEPMLQKQFFPSFSATKIVSVGSFLSRLEESLATYLIFTGLVHFIICLYVVCLGVGFLINAQDEKGLYLPFGLLSFTLSCFAVRNMVDLTQFLEVYPYAAAPFQIGLPVLLFVVIEVRARLKKKKEALPP